MALVDCNTYGFNIMSVFRHGSEAMAFENHKMAVPDIKWLGIHPAVLKSQIHCNRGLENGVYQFKNPWRIEEYDSSVGYIVLKNSLGGRSSVMNSRKSSIFICLLCKILKFMGLRATFVETTKYTPKMHKSMVYKTVGSGCFHKRCTNTLQLTSGWPLEVMIIHEYRGVDMNAIDIRNCRSLLDMPWVKDVAGFKKKLEIMLDTRKTFEIKHFFENHEFLKNYLGSKLAEKEWI
ncbi:hypothetical protein Tco_1089738 [Tanacetum coccineum]